MLDSAAELGIPIVVNFNPVVPGQIMLTAADHPACDALWIANTIPWGDPSVDWQAVYKSTESPLKRRGLPVPGGLSGPACLPVTIDKIKEARGLDIVKPIVAGNGIQSPADVQAVRQAGADAVAIGIVGLVRPWRMRRIIRAANRFDGRPDVIR
jgi:dihydroorotate dehydrogenase